MELDAEQIQAIARVLNALADLGPCVKIRGVTFDVQTRYGHETKARVRLTGARSCWSTSIRVTKIAQV